MAILGAARRLEYNDCPHPKTAAPPSAGSQWFFWTDMMLRLADDHAFAHREPFFRRGDNPTKTIASRVNSVAILGAASFSPLTN